MRLGRWLVIAGAGFVLLRTELPIRLIRAIDQRLALFAPRGAGAYSRHAPRLLAGLYRTVVTDLEELRMEQPTIVDLGSGPGSLLQLLAAELPGALVIGVEPSAEMRQLAAEHLAGAGLAEQVTLLEGSAERIPLADASVTAVVSTLSAHHWSDPVAAFREIGRCLAPRGMARIYDVRFAAFTARELRELASAAGFDPAAVRREVLGARVGPLRPFVVSAWHA